jgi:hypothetical protein
VASDWCVEVMAREKLINTKCRHDWVLGLLDLSRSQR